MTMSVKKRTKKKTKIDKSQNGQAVQKGLLAHLLQNDVSLWLNAVACVTRK